MKNKLKTEMNKIISNYQEILDNWSDFDSFYGAISQCQQDINALEFSSEDYLNEEIHGLLFDLKKLHHLVYQKSSDLLLETKNKYEAVAASKNKILKYSQGD